MARKIFDRKHPLAIRWFHWLNFPLLLVMIWSGLLIYWANDVYRVGSFHFFPEWFYNVLHLDHRLAEGMALHFAFMWFFAINGVCYVAYTFLSGEWRILLPGRGSLRSAWHTLLHDLRIRKQKPEAAKFNGAQQITYTAVIVMGSLSLVTGLAIYKPVQVSWLTRTLGGYTWARAEHFTLTMGYVFFFVVHIVQVIRAGYNNFRAMITGYEVTSKVTNQRTSNRIRALDRRGFLYFGTGAIFSLGAWGWLRTRPESDSVAWPLRKFLNLNETLSSNAFTPYSLAPTFPRYQALEPRANGDEGLSEDFDASSWKLSVYCQIEGAPEKLLQTLSIDEILALPQTEMVTELKCIEGWSTVVAWEGARFSDFISLIEQKTKVPLHQFQYVGLETPDQEYYVGMDMPSVLHPQTLLCHKMNGSELSDEHGAPLRLATPLKYGIKSIKRIGQIRFTNTRPKDYWAEQGYDWYAGH